MAWLEEPKKGDPITHEWAVALVRAINGLAHEGPEVVAPLAKHAGAIYLAQDYQVYSAMTTGTIRARAGTIWGSGAARFLTIDAAGNETTMGGNAAFTAWNYTGGTINPSIRIQIVWSYDKWVIISADCSGVA